MSDRSTSAPTGIIPRKYIFALPEHQQVPIPTGAESQRTRGEVEQEVEDAASEEAGNPVFVVKGEWVQSLYRDLATAEDIGRYLTSEDSTYDLGAGHWAPLSKALQEEHELSANVTDIVASILRFFHRSLPPGVSRTAIHSHDHDFIHDNGKHARRPSVAIRATGPSFEVPAETSASQGLGYTNVASVIDTRLNVDKWTRQEQAKQLAISSRLVTRSSVFRPNQLTLVQANFLSATESTFCSDPSCDDQVLPSRSL